MGVDICLLGRLSVCLCISLCICTGSSFKSHFISDTGEVSVDNSADEERVKQNNIPLTVLPQPSLLSQTTTLLPPQGGILPPIQSTTLLPTNTSPQQLPIFTTSNALSIQNILNSTNTPLFFNSEVKKPVVTLIPTSPTTQLSQEVDVITPSCDIITSSPRDVTSPMGLPKICLSPETAQPTL